MSRSRRRFCNYLRQFAASYNDHVLTFARRWHLESSLGSCSWSRSPAQRRCSCCWYNRTATGCPRSPKPSSWGFFQLSHKDQFAISGQAREIGARLTASTSLEARKMLAGLKWILVAWTLPYGPAVALAARLTVSCQNPRCWVALGACGDSRENG
jgi:hypothetical protein